jgi:rhodanese-related sulfurtransferase
MNLPNVTVAQLANWREEKKALHVLDVRRAPAFEKNPLIIPGAKRVLPEDIPNWIARGDRAVPVVAYCVYGHEVSQNAAESLIANGFNAAYLTGGLTEWQSQGGEAAAVDA